MRGVRGVEKTTLAPTLDRVEYFDGELPRVRRGVEEIRDVFARQGVRYETRPPRCSILSQFPFISQKASPILCTRRLAQGRATG